MFFFTLFIVHSLHGISLKNGIALFSSNIPLEKSMKHESLLPSHTKHFLVHFATYFLPSVFLVVLYSFIIISMDRGSEELLLREREDRKTTYLVNSIVSDFQITLTEVMLLSVRNELRGVIETNSEFYRKALEEEYLTYAQIKAIFEEITFIDENGMEVVRVRLDKGNPVLEHALRDCSGDPYFRETMKIETGGIYISPLIAEQSDTAQGLQHKTYILIGVPLSDSQHRRQGILLVKHDTDMMIKNFELIAAQFPGQSFLINFNGALMESRHPGSAGNPDSPENVIGDFRKTFPAEWQRILKKDRDWLLDEKGFFTFQTFYPIIKAKQLLEVGRKGIFSGHSDPGDWDYFWKVVSYTPVSSIRASAGRFFRGALLFDLVVVLLLGMASGLMARTKVSEETARERLKESEAQYSTLVRNAIDGVFMVRQEVITFANEAMAGITGYSASQLAGMRLPDLIVPEDKSRVENTFSITSTEGTIPSLHDVKITRRDGTTREVEISAGLLYLQSVPVIIGIMRDATERKRAERELQEIRKEFIDTLVHDMKSPLSSMMAYLRLVNDPRSGSLSQKQRDYSEMIRHSCEVLLSMINNLVDASRIEAGKLEYDFENFRLRDLIDELYKTFAALADLGKIALRFDCPEDAMVLGDRSKIREVFYNLIHNALRYTPAGGTVSINAAPGDGDVAVTVSDTGRGIPESEQHKLFEKFVQVKGDRRGTGLGLYIVKNILSAHGSSISFESIPGCGTKFFFALKKGEIPGAPPREHHVIFLLSENEGIINFAREALRENAYSLETFTDGSNALEKVALLKPDLFLIHGALRDMEAAKFLELLQMNPAARNIPSILISTFKPHEGERGFSAVLTLPVDSESLEKTVREVLHKGLDAPESEPPRKEE